MQKVTPRALALDVPPMPIQDNPLYDKDAADVLEYAEQKKRKGMYGAGVCPGSVGTPIRGYPPMWNRYGPRMVLLLPCTEGAP